MIYFSHKPELEAKTESQHLAYKLSLGDVSYRESYFGVC